MIDASDFCKGYLAKTAVVSWSRKIGSYVIINTAQTIVILSDWTFFRSSAAGQLMLFGIAVQTHRSTDPRLVHSSSWSDSRCTCNANRDKIATSRNAAAFALIYIYIYISDYSICVHTRVSKIYSIIPINSKFRLYCNVWCCCLQMYGGISIHFQLGSWWKQSICQLAKA